MNYSNTSSLHSMLLLFFLLFTPLVKCQLDCGFYDRSCPNLNRIVRYQVWSAIRNETRMAASLLRLHFHDCIVNGCDASVLLDDADNIKSEKNALPNLNSARGFEVIDDIKAIVEKACPLTVSCADILTLAAREAVFLAGGPFWSVPLGRRDGTTASESAANDQVPGPFDALQTLTFKFTSKGLDSKDVVILSGGHTIGFAHCFTFKSRLFNFDGNGNPDPTLDSSLLENLQTICPDTNGSNTNLAPLDRATASRFDNLYYKNLMNNSALLQSDQALMGSDDFAAMVANYSKYPSQFFSDFGPSMVKLGNVGVITGQDGQIRNNCSVVN